MIKRASLNGVYLVLLFGFHNMLWAQHSPTSLSSTPEWKISVDKKEVKVGDEVTVTFTSAIEKDWYMYSNDFDPNLGPIAAEFTFTKHASYSLNGKPKPVGSHKHYEEVWKGDVAIFKNKAEFKQKIKILSDKPVIKGSIYFQECNEISGVCMPPFDVEFEVKGITVVAGEAVNPASTQEITPVIDTTSKTQEKDTASVAPATSVKTGNSKPQTKGGSFVGFLLIAFGAGLVAVVTPCVFPMLPMTVSFFTKRSETRAQGIRRASTFGLSIVGIYASLGLVFAFFGLGLDFGNWLSTHWLPNILFFVIFIVFAASFLGAFEITLPHSLVNKIDSKSSMGSFTGIFFMAFTLTLVSFSCTGPIVSGLLAEAIGGQFTKPLLGMATFGFGLALPFTLFALFPGWMQNLPKSGGWLNSVKVVLGFIELAFAFKFLSTADVVYGWHILDREVFLVIWIVLAILLGIYLLGKLKFSHDSDLPYVSVPRFMLAVISFCFALYMIPGLFGAPLRSLAGLLPPLDTQDFVLSANATSTHASSNNSANVKHADLFHIPHGLSGFFDYKQALEESKKQNKPIFIDFTGKGCVNCRRMEENVWVKPEVLKRLKNDFIIVSLYADSKTELPESEWYTSSRDGKLKKTIGAQVSDLQITKYNFSAQPQYVVIDGDENQLSGPNFFDTDEQKFVDFLDQGKNAFHKK